MSQPPNQYPQQGYPPQGYVPPQGYPGYTPQQPMQGYPPQQPMPQGYPQPMYQQPMYQQPMYQQPIQGQQMQPRNYQPQYQQGGYPMQQQGGYPMQQQQGGYPMQQQGGYPMQQQQYQGTHHPTVQTQAYETNKPLDIADTNMALFGTPLEKEIKKASAQTEPAWQNAGKRPGLQIWRIEKFKVKSWPRPGQFFDGDSFIILNTYKQNNKFLYDVHFWLGTYTTQDEAGTAAYKTVELDTLLDDLPVQHREVQGHESEKFCTYFPNGIRIMSGGIESGFNKVKPKEYKTKLLHVHGTFKTIECVEVPLSLSSLNSGDVFICDAGLTIYQWNGTSSNGMERNKAARLCKEIQTERTGKATLLVMDQGDADEQKFFEAINKASGQSAPAPNVPIQIAPPQHYARAAPTRTWMNQASSGDASRGMDDGTDLKVLFQINSNNTFQEVARGVIRRNLFHTNACFVLDNCVELFVWIGRNTDIKQRSYAMQYANNYIKQYNAPAWTPVTRVIEGRETPQFTALIN